jgi:adenylate kinase family enzyme
MSAPRKIVIVGTTGSGKTTAARRLSSGLGVPHVELDALYHGPNWTPAEPHVFRRQVAERTSGDGWIAEGNYRSLVQDVVWERADLLIWLDYGLPRILRQLIGRIFSRGLRRQELWNGNRESVVRHFTSRESLILWAFTSRRKYRGDYPDAFGSEGMRNVRVVRVRSPRELERVLAPLLSQDARHADATIVSGTE